MALARIARRAAALSFLASGATAAADDPAFGLWLVESGDAIIRIGPCGDRACGEIAWLRRPSDADGALLRDVRNPDPALRDRPLCGLPLLSGFRREAHGAWRDGEIYNGRNGKTYSAQFTFQDDGTLKLRGYVGLPILGASQVWTRAGDDRGGCPED